LLRAVFNQSIIGMKRRLHYEGLGSFVTMSMTRLPYFTVPLTKKHDALPWPVYSEFVVRQYIPRVFLTAAEI